MRELILTGEILGVILVLMALASAGLIVRRNAIARGGPMVLMSVRTDPDASWRTGMARVGNDEVAWFPIIGVRVRPSLSWQRGSLELGPPQAPDQRPVSMTDPVQVSFMAQDAQVDVVVPRSGYTTVRSWSESAPPGLNTNVA